MKAVIFDMDGVIADTNPHHHIAWKKYYERHGKTLSDEEFVQHISGKHNNHILAHLFEGRELSKAEGAQLAYEKEALFRELYHDFVQPVPGLITFLESLKAAGIKMAVATSAPVENLDFVIDALQFRPYFDALLNESLVTRPKPDPEIYLKAMQLLGVEPAESVVFEDSITGINAGKAAGARVVGVATTEPMEVLRPLVSDVIVDFTEMSLERLYGLFPAAVF